MPSISTHLDQDLANGQAVQVHSQVTLDGATGVVVRMRGALGWFLYFDQESSSKCGEVARCFDTKADLDDHMRLWLARGTFDI